MLDGILGNQTDLLITEHATDTHGATLANFALFDLVGLQLSPRIRDLGKITLYRTGPRADFAARYPSAGHLLTRRLNEDLITGMWDDLLRVAASVKGGHATAALVVGKLCSSRRQQNTLASAIKEYGALRRTVYAARYLVDETYRRRIGRQLNKGENVHALKRTLAYAGEGALRRRHHEEQAEQMWCLTLATNAVVTWTTEYHGLAVTALRRAGPGHRRRRPGAHLAHPPRERPLLRHPLRRRRRRARQARLRRLPAAARRRRHGAGPVRAGKPEIRSHRLRAHPGRVASFVIGDRNRRLVTYGDDSAVARHAISADMLGCAAKPGWPGVRAD